MTVTLFTVIMPLSALLVGSLYMSKVAGRMQDELLLKLHRLATLEHRRQTTRDVIKNLEAMDEYPDLMRALYLSLKSDLVRFRELDPARPGLEAEINHATARHATYSSSGAETNRARLEKETSFESLQDVAIVGGHLNEALAILRRLKRLRRISASHFDSARGRLRYLSAMVSINSSIRMAQMAVENRDSMKALACYRRAESILQMGMLDSRERASKLALINTEKEKLYEKAANEKGLMMLARSGA